MKHISLFSGIGGFDLAAQWMGWENIAHCEWNHFAQRILKYYWPDAISYEDITKTDFSVHRGTIDIVTGGFPCQPYSAAGKRKGKDDERHLWPEMLRAIREIQPSWVVGENVSGLVNWNGGLVFEEVQADLENEGYKILPFLLPAASVQAPHIRERVWFIAYSNTSRNRNVMRVDKDRTKKDKRWERQSQSKCRENGSDGIITNSQSIRGRKGKRKEADNSEEWEDREHISKGNEIRDRSEAISGTGISSDSCGSELERFGKTGNIGKTGKNREKREWIYVGTDIQPGWENFPTQSPIYLGNDGLSSRLDGITFSKFRKESIKAGGNAIVPQLALQIFKVIEQYQKLNLEL